MRILITGASGFIGGRTVERLADISDHQVICPMRKNSKGLLFPAEKVKLVVGDINDIEFLKKVSENVDAIIHCAGLAGYWGEYELYHQANVVLVEKILAIAQ